MGRPQIGSQHVDLSTVVYSQLAVILHGPALRWRGINGYFISSELLFLHTVRFELALRFIGL